MSTETNETVENPYEGMGFSESELESLRLNDDGSDPDDVEVTEPEVEEPEEVEEVEAPEEVVAVAEAAPEAAPEEVVAEVTEERVPLAPEDLAFAPQFKAEGVQDFKGATAKLNNDYEALTDELATKYENGDFTFTEFRKQERVITREYESIRQELIEANLKAEIAADYNKQSSEQKWELEQNLFYSDNADYRDDAILRGALSAQLNVMYDDPANQGKSGLWFLREASKVIDAKFSRTTDVVASKDSQEKLKQAQDTMSKRRASQPDIPKTLAGVPSAEANEESVDEFAFMDKLGGVEYERALGKMNEAQRDRYMAA